VPIMKIAELLAAGCELTILLADIHAYLDNMKAPLLLVEYRAKYYESTIKALLKAVGVDISKLKFILGSSYQLGKEYTMDRFKLEGMTRISQAQKAGAEVVKQTTDPSLGGLIYPLMQSLDEQYLGVDAHFGGIDQRKIFTFAKENLPKIGYKVRAHLMNSMVPGLGEGGKMSASEPNSKIDLLDAPEVVQKKLRNAICAPKEVEGNGLIAFLEHVIFRAQALKNGKVEFIVDRTRDQLEPLVYSTIEPLKKDYTADILTPQLLKPALTLALNTLLAPIRAEFDSSPSWQEIEKQAYPIEVAAPIPKRQKKLGDPAKRAAAEAAKKGRGASGVTTNPDGSVEGAKAEEVSIGADVTAESLEKLDVNEKK